MSIENRPYRCADTRTHADEFIDSELGPHECDRIDQHLEHCPSCRAYFSHQMALKSLVQRACACDEVPADLQFQVMARISALRLTIKGSTFESLTFRAAFERQTDG